VSPQVPDDPTAWFDLLYREAADGRATVPWDRREPAALLTQWVERQRLDGTGRTAIVVGCGLGRDAELIARLGFTTTAFDVSPTAIETARERHPDTTVDYQVADLRRLPEAWHRGFDLVVESLTVQSLPISLRDAAIRAIAELVAPGGTLIALAVKREEGQEVDGPPWPLTRSEIDAFAATGLTSVSVEEIPDADDPRIRRWRAELRRKVS
jgi:SAM-dependent methyltransferase